MSTSLRMRQEKEEKDKQRAAYHNLREGETCGSSYARKGRVANVQKIKGGR